MKFVCDKCKTKYSIADEKVRGKVLKIRCKNCANIIVVREAAAKPARKVGAGGGGGGLAPSSTLDAAFDGAFGAPEPLRPPSRRDKSERRRRSSLRLRSAPTVTDQGSEPGDFAAEATRLAPPPQPDESAEDEWFLAVDGNQYGPMTFAELCSRVKRGEARSETGEDAYCWRDGFDDWVEVTSVPELRPYAPPPPPPRTRSGLFNVQAGLPGAPPPPPSEGSRQGPLPPMPAVPALPPGSIDGGATLSSPPPPTPAPFAQQRPDPSAQLPRPPSLGVGVSPGLGPTPPPSVPAPAPPLPVASTAAPVPAPLPAAPPHASAPGPLPVAPSSAGPSPELAAMMESGVGALPAAVAAPAAADVTAQPSLPAAVVPASQPSKTPLSIKVAAFCGIVSTITGLAILAYFLIVDRPPSPAKSGTTASVPPASKVGEKPAVAAGTGATAKAPEPDAGTTSFPPMTVARNREKVPKHARKRVASVRRRRKSGKKLSAADKRLLALYGKGGAAAGTAAVPSALVKKRRSGPTRRLNANDIGRAQRRNARQLKACYERAAKRDHTLKEVRVDVILTIGGSGIVTRSKLKFKGGKSVTLEGCLRRNLRRWHFPSLGGSQRIAFPLIFRGT